MKRRTSLRFGAALQPEGNRTMSEPVWNEFLTERDKAVFAVSGYGARGGFGKRPALLIIDVNWAFCGDRPEPILESIKRWRNSCGEDAWRALPYIRSLIDTCARVAVLSLSIRISIHGFGTPRIPNAWGRS
jgi:hypothetical protein